MPRPKKWTAERLKDAVAASRSVADVLRALQLRLTGGNYTHIRRCIEASGLSTEHFTGQSWRAGTPGANRKAAEEVLVPRERTRRKEDAFRLRRALVETGVPETCQVCGGPPEWNGAPLRLQVDHIDGDPWNNVMTNLRFLCPNCHSQTANFGNKRRS